MPTSDEPQPGRRLALVIATEHYADPTLARLRTPGRDAAALGAVLEDERIGGFDVETVLDARADDLRRRIARFCAQGSPRDVALVYMSCHGVLDSRGRLYYATTDTDHELLSATAVPAAWLNEQLEDCRCRRQLLVLDCCHSGAFAKGAKGPSSLALGERFEGRGRVVLTASRATEYSFEGDEVRGDGLSSVFTGVLVEGLRSGEADRDRDGLITVTELYDYAYEAVRSADDRQTPTLWTYGAEGGLLVAHSPRGPIVEPAPLPDDLSLLLESARPRVRQSAVAELADLLAGDDAGRALTARRELERMAEEDVSQVAEAARAALRSHPAAAPPEPPAQATDRAVPSRPQVGADRGAPSRPPAGARVRRPPVRGLVAALALAALVAVAAVLFLGGGSSPTPDSSSGLGAIDLGGGPAGLAVGGGAAWVARRDVGQLSKIDPRSGRVVASVDVGGTPGKVAAGDGVVWVALDDGARVVRIDPRAPKVVAERGVATDPPTCDCPGPGLMIAEHELWTADIGRGAVRRRDLETGASTSRSLEVDAGFSGAFTVGDGAVWAVGRDDEESRAWLQRVDPDTAAVESFELGSETFPSGVAYGAGAVWIADAADEHNDVIRLDPRSGRTRRIPIDSGISGDDIVFAGRSVVVWEPDAGVLTRIDGRSAKVSGTETASPYETGQAVNTVASELDMNGVVAWVTDPAGDRVGRLAAAGG